MNNASYPMKIWFCKIGVAYPYELQDGSDAPMRAAVENAFRKLIGREPDFCSSGWAGELDQIEANIELDHELRKKHNIDITKL